MSAPSNFNPEAHRAPSEEAYAVALGLIEDGFVNTGMAFNIGRSEGRFERGFDLYSGTIANVPERLYVTDPTPGDSEEIITKVLGAHAILQKVQDPASDRVSIYKVPAGSRLLTKTLRSKPYSPEYMQLLAGRALNFMDSLHVLSKDGFGVSLDQLALTHNGGSERDDVYLTVVPPVLPLPEDFDRSPSNLNQLTRRLRIAEKLGPFIARDAVRSMVQNKTSSSVNPGQRLLQLREWMSKDDSRLISLQFEDARPKRTEG